METRKRKSSGDRSYQLPSPSKKEIRYAILFGFRRKLTPQKIFDECKVAFEENAPCLDTVYEWFRRFKTGNFSVEDEPREGRPRTSTDDTNVAAVKKILDEDPRLTEEMIANKLGLNAMAISRILNDSLGYSKKCSRWVPKILGEEEKEARVRFAKFFLEKFKEGASENYDNLITGDETWIYNSEPETKQQSSVWSAKGEPSPIKAYRQKSLRKVMFAIFFSSSKIIASVPLEHGKTINADWYTDVCLPEVFKNILKDRNKAELRRYFLHHDNAPAHKAEKTSNFIALAGINEISPAPYSPDLAPCDFWLFPKIKEPLRGKVYNSRDEIIEAVNQQLQQLKKEDFKLCFDRWIYRLKKCIEINGNYVEKC